MAQAAAQALCGPLWPFVALVALDPNESVFPMCEHSYLGTTDLIDDDFRVSKVHRLKIGAMSLQAGIPNQHASTPNQ